MFEGELKSREANPGEDNQMTGICAQNEGSIVKCCYKGTMTVKSNWLWEGVWGLNLRPKLRTGGELL